ncbi:MAG: YicC family protein [Deltaproteobacteria bacterium]|nr:YicC family protein [Deltaproteobacteria bacterium]
MSKTQSMTGYGRGEASAGDVTATAEIRSVNHRFADVQLKLPREWLSMERDLVGHIKGRIGRGRLEVMVRRGAAEGAQPDLRLDDGMISRIVAEASRVASQTGGQLDARVSVGELLRVPGVLVQRESAVDAGAEAPIVRQALDQALDALLGMRSNEGARLEDDIQGRIESIAQTTEAIAALAHDQPAIFRSRLERKMRELLEGTEVDEARLLQETAALAARAAIDEEITRLRAHVAQGRELLAEEGPVGRRLEFLVQELAREANTVGSKNDDPRLAELVIALKGTIEAIREQVANVE